jgi:hypothetical protein
MTTTSGDRGERNNNPGNIRHVAGVTWQGQSATQTDAAFVQFDDPVYGIRAIARILLSYEREGIHTIEDAIDRWAPPNENNSAAYVKAVAEDCDISPDAMISLTSYLPCLIKGIIRHENGEQPYTDDQINRGIALAGG